MFQAFDAKRQDLGPLFWFMCAIVLCLFLFGGSARADVQSLAIIRPLSVVALGIGLWSITIDHLRKYAALLVLGGLTWLVVLTQAIPLPSSLSTILPSRDILAEVDLRVGLIDLSRSASMSPAGTENALWSLIMPTALALLGVQLSRKERSLLLPLLLVLGLGSGVLGLLQSIGGPDGALYFYDITNRGAAVGFFANRNHQAVLLACLFPMLAAYHAIRTGSSERNRANGIVILAIGAGLIPLLLVTGSRAGLILGLAGLLAAAVLYSKPKRVTQTSASRVSSLTVGRYVLGIVAILLLGALTIWMSRAEAFQRLAADGQAEDLRFKIWDPIFAAAQAYSPVGSGAGSIVQVYKLHEPAKLLIPNYVNQVHNDWLDLFLTIGLPGIIVACAWLAWLFWLSARAWNAADRTKWRSVTLTRLGSVLVLLWMLASLADYPLRTPLALCMFVIALLWLCDVDKSQVEKAGSV